MAENRFRVSVIIPVYNSEKTIKRAIDSVIHQSRPADEVIVVDDCSADSSQEIIKGYKDKIQFFQLKKHCGASIARNLGIEKSTGNWIAFLDADDEWLRQKLEFQIRLLEKYPSLKWCIGNYIIKEKYGDNACHPIRLKKKACRDAQIKNVPAGCIFVNYFEADRLGYGEAHTNLVLIHRSVLNKLGCFDPQLLRHQDWDLWWRIALRYPEVGYIKEPIARRELYCNEDSMKQKAEVKRGDFIRLVYEKAYSEANILKSEAPEQYERIFQSFHHFLSKRLFFSILMMVFLGHTRQAGETLLRFDKVFPRITKKIIQVIIYLPCMPPILRFGYYIAAKIGFVQNYTIYWEYLKMTKKYGLYH
jgi:glycosyltransferase involved in cell wall biosynthesis